jgi:F-type H+-transporting ATPase subunit b
MISSAFAAEAAGHAAAHGGGLYHAAHFWLDAHFWVHVAFFLVVAYAFKPVARGIGAALDARAAKIHARLEEARKLRDDAQEMLAAYQRKQRDAVREAEEIIAHAKAEAKRLQETAAKELEESVARRERMAMERIAQAEAQATKDVQDLAVDVAISAARQVLAQSITAAQAGSLVDAAIAELPRKLH